MVCNKIRHPREHNYLIPVMGLLIIMYKLNLVHYYFVMKTIVSISVKHTTYSILFWSEYYCIHLGHAHNM